MPDDHSASASIGTSGGRFVRNTWYVAAWAASVEPGKMLARTVLNTPIVLFRTADGTAKAMPDTCPHRFAPLSMGSILPGDRIQCPYHGLEFAADGQCAHNPHGTGAIAAGLHLKTITAVERHSVIWVWLGEKTPTPETIPDFSPLDTTAPEFITEPGYLHMKAGYELIVDNLLDLSHTTYLHAGILGNDETVHAKITVEQDGDVVAVSRGINDITTPGLLATLATWDSPRGDQIQTIRWFAPSTLSLKTGSKPVGRPESEGTGFWAIHLLTPETETTTHYFYTAARWNPLTTDPAKNAEIRAHIYKMRTFAFAEQDAPVIEAQQRRITQLGDPKPTLLAIDAGPVQYRRILDRMIRED